MKKDWVDNLIEKIIGFEEWCEKNKQEFKKNNQKQNGK